MSQTSGSSKVRNASLAVVTAVALVAAAWVSFGTVRERAIWIDPVTGSRMTQSWLFRVITSGPRTEVSPLQSWLEAEEPNYLPQWRRITWSGANLFGGARGHACSTAPPAYHLPPEHMAGFVDQAEDEQLASLVHTLRFGTEDEQDAMIHAVYDEILAHPDWLE